MSKLPVSWSAIPLGQEIEFKKGQKPKFLYEMSNEGLVPYIDIKAFEKGNIRRYADCNSGVIAEANDTLMVWDGARSGLVGNGIAGVIGSTLMRIRPMSSNRNYLHQFLKFNFSQINSNTKGTGIPHVSPEFLFDIDIPLAPLPEQKRIADKLDAVLARVDACRDRLDRIPAILKRFRQSVLAAATSGKLTEDWRADQVARMQPQAESGNIARDSAQSHYVVTAAPDSATLHPGYEANAVDWQQTDVQSVAHVGTGSTPLRSNSTFFAPTGTPWVTSAATSQTLVTDANEFVTQAAITAHRLKMYPIGTLLVAMYGEGKTRGQVTELGIPATINQACAAIVVNEEKALKNYVQLALQANYFEMRELAEGGNQPNLNLSKIKEFPLSLPGITEQTEIVRRVEALFIYADRLEVRHTTARAQVEKLTPATLAKAFRGELVPQDPNDEPASVLLERIRAQRDNKTKARKSSMSPSSA